MIIACPECSGPFEIPDDRIAALVQIECPHCSFRMILDFAAANDPSLVEEGMRMASGYRSAADYRAAAAGAVAEPTMRPAPPVEEVAPRPEPALRPVPQPEPERPAARPPLEAIRPAPVEPARPVAQPRPVAAEAAPTPVQRTPPHEVRRTPVSPQPQPEPVVPPRGQTQVGPAPTPPVPVDYDEDAPTRIHDVESITAQAAELPARGAKTVIDGGSSRASTSDTRRPAARWTPAATPTQEEAQAPAPEQVETRPEAELPVTPVPRPAIEVPRAAAATHDFGDDLDSADLDDYPVRKGSVAGTIFVAFLLIAALGLLGASLAIKNTPDPRPLLQDLIRQYM